MKSFKNILLISGSSLVGAPQNIMKALNNYTSFNSSLIVEQDYRGARAGYFTSDSIVMNDENKDLVISLISSADIIQIHNKISEEFECLILEHSNTDNYIYQVHSPLRESPLYYDITNDMKIPFKVKAACAQYHGYIYPEYRLLPLIVNYKNTINLYDGGELKILFCPSHSGLKGRWNRKSSEAFNEVVEKFAMLPGVNIIRPSKPVKPLELYEMRKHCHITIDEVITGTFHTVSLEGLCAGTVVINNSDFFANRILQNSARAGYLPPFYRSTENSLLDDLITLYRNPHLVREYQEASAKYYSDFLSPKKLISRYCEVYDELLLNCFEKITMEEEVENAG
ncbi:MAG: hypothetical protein RPR97_15520 [Colwellia sp.]|jgi:hypothetical protein